MNHLSIYEPTVSVIMAVKNGGQEVRQAVESILNQTLTDFEFIIINDGSTDDTLETLAKFNDPRPVPQPRSITDAPLGGLA